MPQLTVRNLDDAIYEALKARAKRNHRSLEAEARDEQREEFLRWAAELRERIRPHYKGDVTAEIRAERDSR